MRKTLRYYATAAAAAEAGFRSCALPAGMSAGHARLAGHAEYGFARLAAHRRKRPGGRRRRHIGIAARRGFAALAAAFPAAPGSDAQRVAHTRRLHFAKKLIDETRLPMTEVALPAGFGCVRRFNAEIRKVYRRTPTQIRIISRMAETPPDNEYSFRRRFRPRLITGEGCWSSWARALRRVWKPPTARSTGARFPSTETTAAWRSRRTKAVWA